MEENIYKITKNDADRRIDRIIRKLFPGLPMSLLYKYMRKGDVRLNSRKVQPATHVKEGDELLLKIPNSAAWQILEKKPEADTGQSKWLRKLLLYENKHLLAVNKPRGVLVHGHQSLEEAVRVYLAAKLGPSLAFKPGPAHRLDRNTSGILLFSASLEGARELATIFRQRNCAKYYLALCDGLIMEPATWRDTLERSSRSKKSFASDKPQAREAITKVVPVFRGKHHTLALMQIQTGRTHQIRLQAAIHNHPLTGDLKYRGSSQLPWFILHAAAFKLQHPSSVTGFQTLVAPLPESSAATLKNVFNATAIKKAYTMLKRRL